MKIATVFPCAKVGRTRLSARHPLVALLVLSLLWPVAALRAGDYAARAGLSFLKQAEDTGTIFKEDGQAKPGLQIFKDHGYNWIRLRLFHTPTVLPNSLEYTL